MPDTEDRRRVLRDLVIRAQLGDMGAFSDLVRRFQRMAWGYAYARIGDFHRAEDAAQEAFADAYVHLGELRDPRGFPSWLRTVVRKHADRETRRRRVRVVPFVEEEHASDQSAEACRQAERREILGELHRVIGMLPDCQRTAATLCYVDGFSAQEIADFLDVGEGTVRKRLFDARRAIARLFPKEDAMEAETMMRGLFERHMAPSMVRRIMEKPAMVNLRGERRELTTLFIDVVGCLSLFDAPPLERAIAQLNEYFTAVREIVLDRDGFMDKVIGDEVMAFWGAPLPAKDHALQAALAALEMQRALVKLREAWAQAGRPPLHASIGIHTGEVVIGNFGPPDRLEYTPMGTAVNLAARLETETRKHGVDIIVSGATVRHAGGGIEVRDLGTVQTKAHPEPIRIYELLRESGR